MQTFKHPNCNTVLLAGEENAKQGVVDLHIWRGVREYAGPDGELYKAHCVESFWKPDEEEIAALIAGGSITLSCFGMTSPPVWVGVTP